MTSPPFQLDPPALRVLIGSSLALATGSAVRLWALRGRTDEKARERRWSLVVWWLLLIAVFGSAAGGTYGVGLLFSLVTLYALIEYLPWVLRDASDRRTAITGMVLVPVQYAAMIAGYDEVSWLLVPVGGLVLMGAMQAVHGNVTNFIRATGGLYWGVMVFGFLPSLAARLVTVAPPEPASTVGWYLYVMLLTPLADIFQALVGRRWGRRAITPTVSPHKTWEGFLGGAAATGIASILLAPWLTPWSWLGGEGVAEAGRNILLAFGAGGLLCAVGFFGDIHVSAMKRDVGVKDSGDLLPGQGGMIDRIDSLTFTGTVFCLLVVPLYGP